MGLNGNYNSKYGLVPIADIGGQKLLGMSGSLTNYINTGNAGPVDEFMPADKNNPSVSKKSKKMDIFGAIGALIATGVAAYALIKTGNISKVKEFFASGFDKISKNASDFMGKIKNKLPNTQTVGGKNIGQKVSDSLQKFAQNIKDKFAKAGTQTINTQTISNVADGGNATAAQKAAQKLKELYERSKNNTPSA